MEDFDLKQKTNLCNGGMQSPEPLSLNINISICTLIIHILKKSSVR